MKEGKPFFFRIDLIELMDFATEPAGESMSLLKFTKELKSGKSDHPAIQRIIDEAHAFIAKKAESGRKGMENRWLNNKKEDNTAITPLSSDITNDNDAVTRSSSSNRSNTETETKPKVKRFVPPSVEEVRKYMKEISFDGDANKWVDFYSSKGWMIGKTKMVDWKAGVRTWKAKDAPVKKQGGRSSDYEKRFLENS